VVWGRDGVGEGHLTQGSAGKEMAQVKAVLRWWARDSAGQGMVRDGRDRGEGE